MTNVNVIKSCFSDIADSPHWTTWRIVDGRKIPDRTCDRPETWLTLEQCRQTVGLQLHPEASDYVVIDLDDCYSDGELSELAKNTIELFKDVAYIERSVSGNGLHIIVRGRKPTGKSRGTTASGDEIECYDRNRYFILTGDCLPGFDREPQPAQSELDMFCTQHLGSSAKQASSSIKESVVQTKCKDSVAPGRPSASERASRYALSYPPAISGQDGHGRTYALACAIANGFLLDEPAALAILESWNQTCVPPWTTDELRHKVQDAIENRDSGGQEPGWLLNADSDKYSHIDISAIIEKGGHHIVPNQFYGSQVDASNSAPWITIPSCQTEKHLADRFIGEYESKLRYVPAWKKWLVWDSKRWKIDVDDNRTGSLCGQFADSLVEQFPNAMRQLIDSPCKATKRTWKFIADANKKRGIFDTIKLASKDRRVAIDFESLNSDGLLLNVRNGTVDLRTGRLQEHEQADLITQIAAVKFDASAACPKWEDALQLIFAGDTELIGYVQRLLGYAITGLQSEHILPIAFGNGCNGKSMMTNVILGLLGDYGYLANDTLLLGLKDNHPTEKAALYQKRFVAVSEPEQGSWLRESRVKELTGDSTITACYKFGDFWSFERTHTFWMSTNHLPRIKGGDDGIWRRVKLIPFEVDLRQATKPIPDLDKLLLREEGPGILNWLIRGYLDYQADGFREPERVRVAVEKYRDESDEIKQFIADRCEVGEHCEGVREDLYEEYQSWGGRQTSMKFGVSLGKTFRRDRVIRGGKKKTVYFGIQVARNENGDL